MTMKSNAVKKNSISNLFLKLNDIINSDTAISLCGKHKQDFTRRRNITCIDIIYYFISLISTKKNRYNFNRAFMLFFFEISSGMIFE